MWIVLAVAFTLILESGLRALHLPGFREADWMLRPLAVVLTISDALLFVAWSRLRHWALLVPVAGLFALTLALEALNVTAGTRAMAAPAAQAEAVLAQARVTLEASTVARIEAEEVVAHWVATESVWSRDGDPSNDGMLAACRERLAAAVAREAGAEADLQAAVAADAGAASTRHPVADVHGLAWWVLGGLAVVKGTSLALSLLVHSAGPDETSARDFSRDVGAARPPVRRGLRGGMMAGLARLADAAMR